MRKRYDKPYDMSFESDDYSWVVSLDAHLLALLEQLVAMGLARSWKPKVAGRIEHKYTATKLMQKVASEALKTMGQSKAK